jgi:hypothetical protein
MPTLQDNTITQNSTTSSQGSNKIPKFDAKSHFFLEDATFTQAAVKAFGVVTGDEFRTTSMVTVSNKKVISMCTGQVFIQPQTGAEASKVNLILKPYKQPINGVSIKYFVYRGLPKSDFLDANNKVLTTGTGFITHVRNEFNNFYSQDPNNPAPDFLSKFIGYPDTNAPANEAQQITDLIDSYFYKISQTFTDETGDITNSKRAFEFPMIQAGTHLATATGEIGLDIVLNHGDYYIENDTNPFQLDLKFARLAEHRLNAATVTDAYQKKVLREAATQFIDPAAYYGLHANGGSIYTFGQAQPKKTATDIYALITPFATKNNIYLYVQSNRQRSYNFYGNYEVSDTNSNNIKIGTTEANLAETTFETSNWPVKIFNTAPAAGSTMQTIALQLTTDRKRNTSLFGVLANIKSTNQENFVNVKDLLSESDADGALSYFTKVVIINSPVANNLNIASLVQLVYLGKEIILSKPGIDDSDPATPPPDPILFTTKYMDDVFYLAEATSFLEADKVYHVHSYKPTFYNQQDIDKKRKRVVSFTQRTQNTIAVNDTQNITLFTYLSVVESESSRHSIATINASPNKEATGYNVQNVTSVHRLPNLPANEYVELSDFTDSEKVLINITLKTRDGSLPTTLVLGITELEHIRLKALLTNVYNCMLYFEPLFGKENTLLSAENVSYQKFKLGFLVDKTNSTPIELHQILMSAEIDSVIVYSTDSQVFYSKDYAEMVVQEAKNILNEINDVKQV